MFAIDQQACKNYAGSQVKGQAEVANQQAAGGALLTTLLGAGLGAAIGGAAGDAGAGAAIGASTGAAGGASFGAGASQNAQVNIQVQYDNAYAQCMYAKGNQVPGFAPVTADTGQPAPTSYSAGPDPALVLSVQNELVRLGYLDTTPDGVMGPRTRSAIDSYQRNQGLALTDRASPRLLAQLQATTSGAAAATPVSSPAAAAPQNWVSPSAPVQAPSPASAAPAGWINPSKTE